MGGAIGWSGGFGVGGFPALDEALVVVGGVDADGGFLDDTDEDGVSVGEDAELFELFGVFEGVRGEVGEVEEEFAAVGVESEVEEGEDGGFSVGLGFGRGGGQSVAVVGYGAAREVEGAGVAVEDDLDAGGVVVDGGVADGCGEGGHGDFGVILEERDDEVEGVSGDFGFVALEVDDDVGVGDVGGDLGDAVGAGGVVLAGHDGLFAVCEDDVANADIVGGDDDVAEALGAFGGGYDVEDEGRAGFAEQGFAGESG